MKSLNQKILLNLLFTLVSTVAFQACRKAAVEPPSSAYNFKCGPSGSYAVFFNPSLKVQDIRWSNGGQERESVSLVSKYSNSTNSSFSLADQIPGGTMTYGMVPPATGNSGNSPNCFESDKGISACAGNPPSPDYKVDSKNADTYTITLNMIDASGGSVSSEINCKF